MSVGLPLLLRWDFCDWCRESDSMIVVTKESSVILVGRSGVKQSLPLFRSTSGLSRITRVATYYPQAHHYLLRDGFTVHLIEKFRGDLRCVETIDGVLDLKISDVFNTGRPVVSVNTRSSRKILELCCRKFYTREEGPPNSLLSRIESMESLVTRSSVLSQKLIVNRGGSPLTSYKLDKPTSSTLCLPGYCESTCLCLKDAWTLILDHKLLVGLPLTNESLGVLPDLEFCLQSPLVCYKSMFYIVKISGSACCYMKSHSFPGRSSGVFLIIFEADIINNGDISLSAVITSRGTKVLLTPIINLKLVDILTRNESLLHPRSEKLILGLLSTAHSNLIVVDCPVLSKSKVIDLLYKIGFKESVNCFILFPSNSHKFAGFILVEVDSTGVSSMGGVCLLLKVHARTGNQCSLFMRFLKTTLSKHGYKTYPENSKNLFVGLVNKLGRELKQLRRCLLENMPLRCGEQQNLPSPTNIIPTKYLPLLELQKSTDITLNDIINFNGPDSNG